MHCSRKWSTLKMLLMSESFLTVFWYWGNCYITITHWIQDAVFLALSAAAILSWSHHLSCINCSTYSIPFVHLLQDFNNEPVATTNTELLFNWPFFSTPGCIGFQIAEQKLLHVICMPALWRKTVMCTSSLSNTFNAPQLVVRTWLHQKWV